MMDKTTFLQFAEKRYGDRFKYDRIPQVFKPRDLVVVTCRKHGNVEMIARDHLRTKHGCPHCASEYRRRAATTYNQDMVDKAKAKYNDTFDYSKVDYTAERKTPVTLVCPNHGEFKITLRRHLHGKYGCPDCGNEASIDGRRKYQSLDDVVTSAEKVHGDKYTYIKYDIDTRLVTYRCQTHGVIERPLAHLLGGRGCPECGLENRTISSDEFLRRAKDIHPEGYEYDLHELRSVNHKITIRHHCGHVYQGRVSNHLSGQGCVRCKVSLGEERIAKFLEYNDIAYIPQYRLSPDHMYRYDFYIPELGLLIEYDGEQHFRPVDYFGGVKTFEQIKMRDREKTVLAKVSGCILIRVAYDKFDILEVYLSRAIGRHFNYRVNRKFYRNIISLCDDLGLPDGTTIEDIKHLRTTKVLLSPPSQ